MSFMSAILAAGLAATAAPAATAATAKDNHGCGYNNLCFYKSKERWDNGNPTSSVGPDAMSGFGSGYRPLYQNRGSYAVYDSLDDFDVELQFKKSADCLDRGESKVGLPADENGKNPLVGFKYVSPGKCLCGPLGLFCR
jgi:hypothetical protein